MFLPEKMSAACSDAQRREQDERVAVGVAAAEVEQIHFVRALAERHLVLERPLRQSLAAVLLEDGLRRHGLIRRGAVGDHLLHVRPRCSPGR